MRFYVILGMGVMVCVLFALYWYLVFAFMDTLLEGSKLKKVYRLPVGLLNIAIIFLLSSFKSAIMPYLALFVWMLLAYIAFYRDKVLNYLFCASICMIHVLAVMAVTIGVFSLSTGYSPAQISNEPFWAMLCATVALLVLNAATMAVPKLLPLHQIQILNRHREHKFFIVAWMTVSNAYLFYNPNMFQRPDYYADLAIKLFLPLPSWPASILCYFLPSAPARFWNIRKKTLRSHRQFIKSNNTAIL